MTSLDFTGTSLDFHGLYWTSLALPWTNMQFPGLPLALSQVSRHFLGLREDIQDKWRQQNNKECDFITYRVAMIY
jgi:hypothetical protein